MRRLSGEETAAALRDHGLDRPSGVAFAFRDPTPHAFYDWHRHDYHQLIYATAAATLIETGRAHYLLPAGRAAWIPADTPHRTRVSGEGGASLYFAPASVEKPGGAVRILTASPVMREMILHALRWPKGADEADPLARSFFRTLALMCGEWLESELPLSLPNAEHPGLRKAMDDALAHLSGASLARACDLAAMSERSFRRRFGRETGMGWQAWLVQARILSAMAQLASGARVTDAAASVGYASLSTFAEAFCRLAGEAPSAYRRRVMRGRPARAA